MNKLALEIRVALLGHVGSGKSTVLNALLQGKYSQVPVNRTTAGVNCFRVHTKEAKNSAHSSAALQVGESTTAPDTVVTAEQVLHLIIDNEKFRSSGTVQESTFNIELAEPICDMRKDTTLVLVDIPSLNEAATHEAATHEAYSDYVHTKWDTFDCAIVVMDVFQGANTEDQRNLLDMIRHNVSHNKDVPVIVLCNKVDDPNNKDVMMLVQEMSDKVKATFQGRYYLHTPREVTFIPISAQDAFVYRMASRQSRQDLKNLDESLIDHIGRDEVGKTKWRNLELKERYEVVHTAVCNKANCDANLKASNFHSFLEALNHHLDGPGQLAMIQKQLDVRLKSLNFDSIVAHELRNSFDMRARLGLPQLNYAIHFWGVYDRCSTGLIQEYASDLELGGLHEAMLQLIEYATFLEYVEDSGSELAKAMNTITSLILKQVQQIVHFSALEYCWRRMAEPFFDWNGTEWVGGDEKYEGDKDDPPHDYTEHHWKRRRTDDGWENVYSGAVVQGDKPVRGKVQWCGLSPLDFCTISKAILLNSPRESFRAHFGQEIGLLEKIVKDFDVLMQSLEANDGTCTRPAKATAVLYEWTKGTRNEHGEFEPLYPGKYEYVVQIETPQCLSDPKHWGHLAFMNCNFVDALAVKPKV
jgi:GTPase SAR1 family protein